MCNFDAVLRVVHHKHIQVGFLPHKELVETVGEHVPCLLVRSETNLGHSACTLELPSHCGVYTLGFSPSCTKFDEGVSFRLVCGGLLETVELLRFLFYDLPLDG